MRLTDSSVDQDAAGKRSIHADMMQDPRSRRPTVQDLSTRVYLDEEAGLFLDETLSTPAGQSH